MIIGESTLPDATQRLVMIRASQINGDAYAAGARRSTTRH